MVCLFNWDDAPETRVVRLESGARVVDYWTDESVAHRDGSVVDRDAAALRARAQGDA